MTGRSTASASGRGPGELPDLRPEAAPPLHLTHLHLARVPDLPPFRCPAGHPPLGPVPVMIPAAFGVIQAAVEALDATLDPALLAGLDPDDMNAAWRAAGRLSEATDVLYAKVRAAYAREIARASRPGGEETSR